MGKRYMAAFLGVLMMVLSVLTPITVNAAGRNADRTFQLDGIKTGDAVADPSQQEAENAAKTDREVSENELSGNEISAVTESVYSYSGALSMGKASKSLISDRIIQIYGADYPLFDVRPNTSAPYSLGQVSAEHIQKALESVNLVRMIAGLPDVYLYNGYSQMAQHGAVVLAANDTLTHTPSQPAGMDGDFYQNGYTAASHSNIAYGWMSSGSYDMPMFTLGYMEDSGTGNVSTVGHRRWILNPNMKYTGFGFAINERNAAYSAMYAFDKSTAAPDYDFISWPSSGNFPTELASTQMPWHVTLNPSKFDVSKMNTDSVKITITAPDGTSQTITGSDATGSIELKYQPYYTINKVGYGVNNAIIFRPGTRILGTQDLSGIYFVTITGLHEKNGNPATISYYVDFFHALSGQINPGNNEAPDDGQITGFANRLYNLCFNREADDQGLIYWKNALINKEKSGAEVAWGFFFSDEMKNRNLSDGDYVELLYRVMMDRSSDAEGKSYWLNRLSGGVSREGVFKGFAESVEFTNICNSYGIDRGTVTVTQGRDRNTGATMFVSRLYTKALGRAYDIGGLNDWCNRICDHTWSATDVATRGFFDSKEFLNKNLSNEEYVKVLYRTFLDREYDEAGLADWVGKLNSGAMSRTEVLKGFSYSKEFTNMMREYGL